MTIGYPESMWPLEQIKGYCSGVGLRIAISPLHDMDLKSDHELTDGDGNVFEVEYKKPHYHILIAFGNTTTFSAVLRHVQAWGCVMPKPVSSIIAMFDYLTHKNENPEEKFIYNRPEDIVQLVNGFDLADYACDDNNYQTMQFIAVENLIDEYIQTVTDIWRLKNFLKRNQMYHELKIVYKNESKFKDYIYYSKKNLLKKKQEEEEELEKAADPAL